MNPEIEDIARLTDSYFVKTKKTVERFGDRSATYAVFMRRPVIFTPKLMVDWLNAVAGARGTEFDIELNYEEGDWVGAGERRKALTMPRHRRRLPFYPPDGPTDRLPDL